MKPKLAVPFFTIPAAASTNDYTPAASLVLAIYRRDSFTCVYCGRGPQHGVELELDHVRAVARFPEGTPRAVVNDTKNLATSCFTCNRRKGNNNLRGFASHLRDLGIPREVRVAMIERVKDQLAKPAPLE